MATRGMWELSVPKTAVKNCLFLYIKNYIYKLYIYNYIIIYIKKPVNTSGPVIVIVQYKGSPAVNRGPPSIWGAGRKGGRRRALLIHPDTSQRRKWEKGRWQSRALARGGPAKGKLKGFWPVGAQAESLPRDLVSLFLLKFPTWQPMSC